MKKILIAIVCMVSICTGCTKEPDIEYHHYGTSFERDGLSVLSSVSAPNSVGGVTVALTIKNYTGRTLKYVSVAGDMRNVFGDQVNCDVTGRCGMSIEVTGPIGNGDCVTFYSSDKFYNNTAKTYCINAVSIMYLEDSDWTHWH